jgi:DnaK suppressor protein
MVDEDRARALLRAERARVQRLLNGTEAAERQDRPTENETDDNADAAQLLTADSEEEAIAARLRDRLDAVDRALRRLDEGTYGRSVRSGLLIPDERLEVDPAAELTIEEARDRR